MSKEPGALQELQTIYDLVPEADSHHLIDAATELNRRLGFGVLPPEVSALIAKRLARLNEDNPEVEIAVEPQQPAEQEVDESPPASGGVDRKKLAAGEYVFREGDQGDEAYLVDSGRIEIVIENGSRVVLATVDRGAIIGEMALIDFEPRMASALVVEDATLFVIPAEVFRARLEEVAEIDRIIHLLLTRYVERLRSNVSAD